MSMQQINLNEELSMLFDEGVQCSLVKETLIVVKAVPYINKETKLGFGTLIVKLDAVGASFIPPREHTAYWVGEQPCNSDGTVISGLVNGPNHTSFGDGIISDYFLSRKPVENGGRYTSYYEKVMQHINMISAPARAMYPAECSRGKTVLIKQSIDLPFEYGDTNASRANISGISECMEHQKVAIVGLGGTGIYLLDFLSKCPVDEIHLFDDDIFNNHNAFRAPGAASLEILNQQPVKVQYAADIYGHMKHGIIPHRTKITPENIYMLDDMDFVFICVDSCSVRTMIATYLADHGKAFVDSGLGLEQVNGHITGQVRVTSAVNDHYDHLKDALSSSGNEDDPYASNIQIAELNCMAAILSVIRWKKLLGFYGDTSVQDDWNFSYCIHSNNLIKNSKYEDQ